MKCPRCQHENPPQAKFCLECGASIKVRHERGSSAASSTDLQRALADALEQQAATSGILRVISQSRTDAQPVFNAIIKNAVRLSDAQEGSVFRFDGHLIHLVASETSDTTFLETLRRVFPRAPGRDSPTARAILTGTVTHVPDIVADPGYELATIFTSVRRTILSVPMLRDGQAIGAITVARRDVRPFSDQQLALLETFAAQAVIAIENVRLFTELEARNSDLSEALDRQTATADILRAISQAQTDVQPVFEALADSAMRLLGAWGAAVGRYDGELLSLAAARGGLPGSADAARERLQPPHRPSAPPEQAVLTKRVQHVVDVETDPSCSSEFRRHAAARGFRSFVAVPMLREPFGLSTVFGGGLVLAGVYVGQRAWRRRDG